MIVRKCDLTAEYVRSLFFYDPETGIFTHRSNSALRAQYFGKKAGFISSNGYWNISINERKYRAHRLAWLYVTGEWPPEDVDHINRDRLDNRFCNLRLASRTQNHMNKSRQSNNVLGFKGVHIHKQSGRYRAQIRISGKRIHIGMYDTPEDAHKAYCEAARRLFGEFAFAG